MIGSTTAFVKFPPEYRHYRQLCIVLFLAILLTELDEWYLILFMKETCISNQNSWPTRLSTRGTGLRLRKKSNGVAR